MAPDNRAAVERLDDALDRLTGRPRATDTGMHLADGFVGTARRVHALDARDAAPNPDPDFVRRLEVEIMHQTLTSRPGRRNVGVAGASSARSGRLVAPARHRVAARSMAELATAAVILLTLAVGFVAYRAAPFAPPQNRPSVPAAVQDATPAASPIVPTECRVAPLTVDEIVALYGPSTAPPRPGSPVPTQAPTLDVAPTPYLPAVQMPEGQSADPATAAAVTATWREFLACSVNWEDRLSAAALLSAEGFGRVYGISSLPELAVFLAPPGGEMGAAPGTAPAVVPTVAAETAPGPTWYGPGRPSGVRVLPDGRVGALLNDPETGVPDPEDRNYVIFVEGDGHWLIDEIVREPAG